ncbi:MAG TPA: hypothetical protein VHE59_09350 [Mucilaginibacter sp.]|nr:hypothetical protein [Mucilaginibacter sp.]
MTDLIIGMVAGATIAAILFPWFRSILGRKVETPLTVVYSGSANHFLNGESVGGKLFLSHDTLCFKSHKFNIQNHELNIDIRQIREVRYYNMLGIFRNMLEVVTQNGAVEKFVVNNRKAWKAKIEQMIR